MGQASVVSRRTFVRTSSAALAAVVSRSVVHAAGANETITLGVIGTGGRGTELMRWAKQQGCNIAALCDVYEPRLNHANQAAGGTCELYGDHRKLLDRKDLDAVIVATPDHWHHDMLIDAVAAGKDVYIEKPLSKTIDEGKSMTDAVRKSDRIVQVGNHRRSGEHWGKAKEVVQQGTIGKVTWCRIWDCRNWSRSDPFGQAKIEGKLDWKRFLGKAPYVEPDAHRYFAWRWFWDYAGGLMTDIGAHQLDIIQRIMNVEGPRSVAANGGVYNMTYWQTPDVIHAILDYGTFVAVFSVGFQNGHDGDGAEFYGTDGTLVALEAFDVYLEKDKKKSIMNWARPYEGQAHMANWLSCIRTRKQPNSPVKTAHHVITAAHLGNISYRTGKRVNWSVEKQEIVSG